MSSDRQLNYVNNLQNRDQKLYYVDDASELNSINLEENDKIYAINDNKLFQMEIVDQEEELSGPIVSFNGRNNTKIKSLVANIEPVQDLHGYENPWPAGGGKNLLQITARAGTNNGVDYTVNKDHDGNIISVVANGTPGGINNSVFLLGTIPAGTYILSGSTGGSASKYYLLTSGGEAYSYDGDSSPFTISAEKEVYIRIVNGFTASNVVFQPMIRLASETDATFAPYSNECPISGWTGAEISGTGVNIWDEEWEVDQYNATTGEKADNSNNIRSKNFISCKPNTTYSFVWNGWTAWAEQILFYDANYNFLNKRKSFGSLPSTFTTPANASYMTFFVNGLSAYNHDISINYPATDTQYHPYTGDQISVTFPDMIYGGEDEVISGKLKSTMGMINCRDIEWSGMSALTDGSGYEVYKTEVFSAPPSICISDSYKRVASGGAWEAIHFGEFLATTYLIVTVPPEVSTLQLAKEYLDNLDAKFVYTFNTPITFTHTGRSISTVYGMNNIWTDIGNITVKIVEKGITAFELEPHI